MGDLIVADHSEPTLGRRTLFAGLAGRSALIDPGDDAATTDTDPDLANDLATRFAPTAYFDETEPWFPTDPWPYVSEPDGNPIVNGFDAVNGLPRAAGRRGGVAEPDRLLRPPRRRVHGRGA